MSSVEAHVETLSQRGLRNHSGRVFRAVGKGQSFTLTNAGVPVGRIVPLDAPAPKLPITRPAKRVGSWKNLKPKPTKSDRPAATVLDELREDRV